MNWENVRCFIAAAEHGSLSEGAQKLAVSVATLGRRVDALEEELGVKLLHRSASGTVVSDDGAKLLLLAQRGAEHLSQLERLAHSLKAGWPDQPVRVSATEPFIAHVLAPQLPRLLSQHPQLQLSLQVSSLLANLNQREADVAIRLVRPSGDNLIARRLPAIQLGMYASADYLGERARSAIRLADERLLVFDHSYGDIPEVRWLRQQRLDGSAVVRTGSTMALLQAAAAGAGVALLPCFLAERHGLLQVAAARIPKRCPWLVFHRDMKALPAVQAVRAWVVGCCERAFGTESNNEL